MNGRSEKKIIRRLLLFLLLVGFVLFAGAGIFAVLESVSYLESLYSVAMVMTGIGSNYDPRTVSGKWFNIVLALVSVGLLVGFLTQIGRLVLRREFLASLHGWRLHAMTDHVIICGISHTSHELLNRLPRESTLVIVRTSDEAHRLQREGINVLTADFTSSKTLKQAGIENARLLLACSESDADNAFTCLTAKHIRKDLPVIARMSRTENREKMQEVGANEIISPAELAADAMIKAMTKLAKT